MRRALVTMSLFALVACGSEPGTDTGGAGGAAPGAGGEGGAPVDPNANPDGDCLTNAEETALGTDPNVADTDGDGFDDCAERDCVSNPVDGAERCYTCGWKHNDPGTLASTGAAVGDVIANLDLIDQCKEPVRLWDFAGEYHILFMTAAW
ncbi:MAG: hypothetical protein HOW73_46905 [Polyangiaceae bacterium]|nr:hypothetical protein [Polyangiaceae bacterium]